MTMGSVVGCRACTSDCYLRLDRRIEVIVSFPQFFKLPELSCGTTGIIIQNSRHFFGGVGVGDGGRIDGKAPGLFRHGWNFVLDTKYSKTIFADALSVCMNIFSTSRSTDSIPRYG